MKAKYYILLALVLAGCRPKSKPAGKHIYQTLSLSNTHGMRAVISENGARLVSLIVPDAKGGPIDVVAGFADPIDYDRATEPYFGATIGRYGNRIAQGRFTLEGKSYQLALNNNGNTLHGGKQGFQYKRWSLAQKGMGQVTCHLLSPDGDQGFPGKLEVWVTYALTENNELVISYRATSDKPTPVNLTNHAFFNLNGGGSILGHTLSVAADAYTPVDSLLIPTGKIASVVGTPFDFRVAKPIGRDIGVKNIQLGYGKGYDHNFVLKQVPGESVAIARGERSGIVMQVFTEEPGLQFYSGNFMQGKNKLRTGPDMFRTAFCLETQHFPDSPNQSTFPSTILKPGDIYRTTSSYRFSVVTKNL